MTERPVFFRRKDFDRFLYSVIRVENCGTDLTVLSVLARQDMDPWEVAEQLSRIPRRGAAAQLSLLIATPQGAMANPQLPDPIVIDLLTKLPQSSLLRRPATKWARDSFTKLLMTLKARLKAASQTKQGKE